MYNIIKNLKVFNMRPSYTNFSNLYKIRIFLFIFLLNSCQLDQSVNLIKEKLFSDESVDIINSPSEKEKVLQTEENLKIIKSDEKTLVEEENSEKKLKTINQELFVSDDFEEDIRFDDTTNKSKDGSLEQTDLIKKENVNRNQLAFKEMGKARDNESKIISFFTKIFDYKEDTEKIKSNNDLNNNFSPEKKKESSEIVTSKIKKKSDVNMRLSSNENNKINETVIGKNKEDNQELLFESESINEENDNATKAEENSLEEESLALLNLNIKREKKEKKDIKKENTVSENIVGLLLPLTGPKSAAGDLVINSLRYSMLLKPTQLNFKIFDTKGDPKGALDAARQGVRSGVKTFIGPIFSDETSMVKDYYSNKKKLTFFSLSPDVNNVSRNVIVSGQNPEDQIACITKHISESEPENILLIYHADRYGYVIRNSLKKFIEDFGISNYSSLQFFEIESNLDLNNELKKLSRFDERKKELEEEILKVENDLDLDSSLKSRQLKKLERMLTLSSPFDSIVVASEGDKLLEILSHLAFYDINSENTNIYGTSLWEDTDKNDIVFNGSIYASSLKKRDSDFVKSFRSVFSRDPMAFNYHMHDLLELVQNYKIYSSEENDAVFYGEFSNSKINSGLLNREIFLKKIKKNKDPDEIFNCRLDAI